MLFNCNSASLAWYVHKHKDGVSHQCPCPPCSPRTKACLLSLESGGSFQRPPSSGGLVGACWALLPIGEGPKLGWRIHSDCPPRGWKTVSLLIPFLRQALQGWAGWGQVWASSSGLWRRGRQPNEVWRSWHVTTHTCTCINTCMDMYTLMHAHSFMQGCSVSNGFI